MLPWSDPAPTFCCKAQIDPDVEQCHQCGLFNSQKYRDRPHPTIEESPRATSSSSNRPKGRKDTPLVATISLLVALIMGYVSSSVFVGIFTFFLALVVQVRVDYLYDHPGKRLKHERHLYTWKGFVAYLVIVILIVSGQKVFDAIAERESIRSEASKKATQEKTKLMNNKKHLEKARLLLAKAPNLTDEEWLNAKSHLTSIPADAAEFDESTKLLPKVTPKADEIVKRRLGEKRKQEALEKKKNFEIQTASLNAKGKRLKAKHPGWSIDECDTISKGKIHVGMTKEQVAAAWGRPYRVNKSVGSYGTHEQWVMYEMGNTYVYFEEGICTSMQGVD